MKTLDYITEKYKLTIDDDIIEIPNVKRDDILSWTHELNFLMGVEIGVARGRFSEKICSRNPQMQVFGVDPFLNYYGFNDTPDRKTPTMEASVNERMAKYENYKLLKMTSMQALNNFYDGALDFVYIDANHFDPDVSDDIRSWYKIVRNNGILSGHDYSDHVIDGRKFDVKEAIQRFSKEKGLTLFVLGTETGRRDKHRSWMIIK